MAFSHSGQHFAHDESNQVTVGGRTVTGGSQNNKDCPNAIAIALNGDSRAALGNPVSFSEMTGNATGVFMAEHGKRLLCDDEAYVFACKRSKQEEENIQGSSPLLYTLSGERSSAASHKELYNMEGDAVPKDLTNKVNGSNWFMCSNGEEKTCLECLDLPVREYSFPSYFEDYHEASRYNEEDEFCTPFLDYFPRKPVALGPNCQADIPDLTSDGFNNATGNFSGCASVVNPTTSLTSPDHSMVDEDDSANWTGRCIMPMPDSALLASDVRLLNCKTECSCLDVGSIRCIRQHIMEAREKLEKTLGQDRFIELGFCDMGEYVAEKWTEEEEHAFHEVVCSNPASLGKNFWEELPLVFPTRTMKELVSYYFNVFMLRKRADQNRLDPLNADSDDDEWQESDDGEFVMEEEDEEDSVVESLADQDDAACDKDDQEEVHITEDTDDGDECEEHTITGENDELIDFSEGHTVNKSKFLPDEQLMGRNLDNCVDEQDNQDDSCTSFEGHHNGTDSCGGPVGLLDTQHKLTEDHEHRKYKNDGLSGLKHHEIDGHCDTKAWHMTFTYGSEKDSFLSTCNMIEIVFGKEASKGTADSVDNCI